MIELDMEQTSRKKIDAIFFIGKPGSGKGRHSRYLADHFGFERFEIGKFLRMSAKNSPEVSETLKKGELLSDELIIALIEPEIAKLDFTKTIVFDDLPRTMSQAQWLLSLLKEKGLSKFLLVVLTVSEEHALTRVMLDRAVAEGRLDDRPEVLRHRFKIFSEVTEPVIEHLGSFMPVERFETELSISEVDERIIFKLQDYVK